MMMDVDQAAKAMRMRKMLAEIEDFLEAFNQPTCQARARACMWSIAKYQIQPIGSAGMKGTDIDCGAAFQRDRLKLLILQHDIRRPRAHSLYLVFVVDRLTGLGIDIAGVDAVAGRAVGVYGKRTFSASEVACSIATGQVTSELR